MKSFENYLSKNPTIFRARASRTLINYSSALRDSGKYFFIHNYVVSTMLVAEWKSSELG